MRINRYLAASGLCSRRAAETLVLEGRVCLNGEPVRELATFVEPGKDRVQVDGKVVRPPGKATYLLLHKPAGYVTTARDPQGRPTVQNLVPRRPRVFPVGRLDLDTSGALLFTDDGDFAHRIQHPRYGLPKEYEATVIGTLGDDALQALCEGVRLEGERRPTGPAEARILERRPNRTRIMLVLHEGRNRQVRRMLEAVGHPVVRLVRLRIGPLGLGDLEPGTHRALDPEEVTALRRESRAPGRRRRRTGRA